MDTKLKLSMASWAVALMLAACGGGEALDPVERPLATTQGTVTGLTVDGLVISNGTDSVAVAANASGFALPSGGSVSIARQPLGFTKACEVGGTEAAPAISCGEAAAKVSWAAGWRGEPYSVVPPMAGPDGRFYFASNQFIYSVLPSGEGGYRILAGALYENGVADGTGAAARFRTPQSMTMDASGTLYVLESDASGYAVRKVTPAGVVSTLASGLGTDTPQFSNLTVGPGNQLYWLSHHQDGTYSVERLNAQGQLELVWSSTSMPPTTNTPNIRGLAVGADGTLYLGDSSNYAIFKVLPDSGTPASRTVQQLAGSVAGQSCDTTDPQTNQTVTSCTDGTGSNATFGYISGLVVDAQGVLYVLDVDGTLVRRVAADGQVTTIVGDRNAPVYDNTDGTGATAAIYSALLSINAAGTELYLGTYDTTVRVVSNLGASAATVETKLTVADAYAKQPSTAKLAFLSGLSAVAADSSGNLIITDNSPPQAPTAPSGGMAAAAASGTVLRQISPQGTVTTLGTSQVTYTYRRSLKLGADGQLYFAGLCSIERVAADGTLSTVTGNPATTRCRTSVDGPAGTAAVFNIADIAPDASGDIYFSEAGRNLRRLDSSGAITTLNLVDETGAVFPSTNWGALASGARGEFYASTSYQLFKVVVQGNTGVVTRVAGQNNQFGVTDGDALTAATFNGADGLTRDSAGNLYLTDNYMGQVLVRQITPAGQVRTLAGGNNNASVQKDGIGSDAFFLNILGAARITASPDGALYVVDRGYLRKIEPVKTPVR